MPASHWHAGNQIGAIALPTREAARSDFGDDDGGAAPMRMLAPPRTPMIRAYPPGIPLALRGAPPHLGRQS